MSKHRLKHVVTAITLILATVSSTRAEQITLSLNDAITGALENNLNLQVERISPEINEQEILKEKAIFDPVFSAGTSGIRKSTELSNDDTETTGFTLETGAGIKLPYGTDLNLSLSHNDNTVKTAALDGNGSASTATLSITQPLLKNRGIDVNTRGVLLAENNYHISRLGLRNSIIHTVAQAQTFYWQYYFSITSLEVQKQSLELARRSLEEMEEKISIGSSPRLELIQSQSEVASREESVIVAENNVYNARDNLLNYIYGSITTDAPIVCSDSPSTIKTQVDEQTVIETALKMRTELLSNELRLRSAETDLNYFKNQSLPDVDLSATLGINEGEADSSISQLQTDDYQDYHYGMLSLSLELPLGKRKDNANRASALLKKRQAAITLEQTKSDIILDVRTAIRNLNSSHKRYQAASLSSTFAAEALKTEQEKFANGLSTSYQVLLFQRDLTDARNREVEALVNYQTAMINLHKSAGTTLEHNNINIDEAI